MKSQNGMTSAAGHTQASLMDAAIGQSGIVGFADCLRMVTPNDAARIVACVNACDGMRDPAVEISGLRSRSDNIPAMCAEVDKLRADNSALRGALQAIVNDAAPVWAVMGDDIETRREYAPLIEQARALLAAGRG